MSKGGQPAGGVFDIERIRQIVELMEQHELAEIDLQQGDEKVKLVRGTQAHVVGSAQPVVATSVPAASVPGHAASGSADPAAAADDGTTVTINSPMVGTFFARSNPEAEPFVKVGSIVSDDTVVCIVEAMKVFNEIPAECRGKIVEVLVQDQQAVDFGKPLFRVQPSA